MIPRKKTALWTECYGNEWFRYGYSSRFMRFRRRFLFLPNLRFILKLVGGYTLFLYLFNYMGRWTKNQKHVNICLKWYFINFSRVLSEQCCWSRAFCNGSGSLFILTRLRILFRFNFLHKIHRYKFWIHKFPFWCS